MKEFLSSSIEADEFIRNIFNIYENVFDSQCEVPSLGLFRSDYLLNCDSSGTINGIKQVENNTIASGLCGITPSLRELYVYILRKLGWKHFDKLPPNESCTESVKGLLSAWTLYKNSSAIIIFVVEESTFNICDQRALEFKLFELNSDIDVLRCTFKYLRSSLAVINKKLYVNNKEVAVVYYRVGYSPKHYEEEDWKTRLLIEQSMAIKCPSAGLHLAGTKKVQLYLTQKKVLERFVSPDVAERLREVFANQYHLYMDEEGDSKAIANPEMFVLKAEREGGGNNLYGDDIKTFLTSMKPEERKSYILMDRINPPASINCIVRPDDNPDFCPISSELGIFGVILGNKDTIFENYSAGHLLRSKHKHLNEGGVAAGLGALDYPCLK